MSNPLKKAFSKTRLGKMLKKKRTMADRVALCKRLSREMPIDEKKVIFSAFSGRLFACSPKALYEAMLDDPAYQDFTFVWAFNRPDEKRQYFHDDRTHLVKFNSAAFFEELMTSKYWIFNFKTPAYFLKRDGQRFLQCWHGTPLKKIGLDIEVDGNAATNMADIHQSYLDDAKKYDALLSPSRYATDRFKTAFGLDKLHKEDIILEVGYPRNDALSKYQNDDLVRIKENLGVSDNRKILLYCPTFRDNQYKAGLGHTYQLGVNLLRLKEKLSDEYILLLRLHYLVSNAIDISQFAGFAIDVSKYDDINDLYAISDLLVTDYSSVFFDYSILERPVIFYMYDLEEYKTQLRDFYIGLDELPGPIVESEQELIRLLKAGSYAFDSEQMRDFKNTFSYLDDGSASIRVLKGFIA